MNLLNLLISSAHAENESWASELTGKFAEISAVTWIALGVIAAMGLVLLLVGKTRRQWNAKAVSFAALSIALSFVLSCFRLYRMPQGGSITPASMLPIMLFSASFGVGPGLLCGLCYGVLQYLQGGWFLNVWQFLLDYMLAYAALGITGIAKKLPKAWGLYAGMVLSALGRAVSATLAGYVFWDTALWPSLVYNGAYLIPDTAICLLLAVFIAKPVMKTMRKE